MAQNSNSGQIDTPHLYLTWVESPWDTSVFGFPVIQIAEFRVHDIEAPGDYLAFEVARDKLNAGLVSCRLPGLDLKESMLLEEHGFRFIEMLYQPEVDNIQNMAGLYETKLDVIIAGESDLPAIIEIAGNAFKNERFHVDPRLDSALADQRYRNWVQTCIDHPTQRLYAIKNGLKTIAFFITEMQADNTCYWHLNAVAPNLQGQGLGMKVWISMLRSAREQGAKKVKTCIVARNYRVLNLYAKLRFHFPPPLMTFHWMRYT